jgi:hypothetical protein
MPSGVYQHKKKPWAERFIGKYDVSPTGCWIWNRSTNKHGYGQFPRGFGQSPINASRASYIAHVGNVPDDLEVCHKCDTPRCVNPEHLFIGTHSDNMLDCIRKGRKNPKRKLSAEDVVSMRMLFASGKKMSTLAVRFGIGRGTVGEIIRREIWKHVP